MFNSLILRKYFLNNNTKVYTRRIKQRLFFFKFFKINSLFCKDTYLYTPTSFLSTTKFFYIFRKWKLFKKKYKKYNTFKFNINTFYRKINNFFLFKINFFLLKHHNKYNLYNINIYHINKQKLKFYGPFLKFLNLKKSLIFYNLYKSFFFFWKQLEIRKRRYKRFKRKYYRRVKIGLVRKSKTLRQRLKAAFVKRRWRRHWKRNFNFFKKRDLKNSLKYTKFLMRKRIILPKLINQTKRFIIRRNIRQNLKYILKKTPRDKQNLTMFFLSKPKSNFFFKKNLFFLKFIFNSYNYKTFLWRVIT